jgi:hypothetical protein
MKPPPSRPRKRLSFTERPQSWGKDDPDRQYERYRDERDNKPREKEKDKPE